LKGDLFGVYILFGEVLLILEKLLFLDFFSESTALANEADDTEFIDF
jgi:hypothetical protein